MDPVADGGSERKSSDLRNDSDEFADINIESNRAARRLVLLPGLPPRKAILVLRAGWARCATMTTESPENQCSPQRVGYLIVAHQRAPNFTLDGQRYRATVSASKTARRLTSRVRASSPRWRVRWRIALILALVPA